MSKPASAKKSADTKKGRTKSRKPAANMQQITFLDDIDPSVEVNEPAIAYKSEPKPPKAKKGRKKQDEAGASAAGEKRVIQQSGLYVQINKGNILSIFSRAIILPASCIGNRPFNDIQSRFNNKILVSKGIIDDLTVEDALLEVFSGGDEIQQHVIEENGYDFITALPVSRIKSIFVIDREAKDKLLADSRVSDAGIIPESMIIPSFPEGLSTISSDINVPPEEESQLTRQVSLFDSILGCMAYTRSVDFLFINKTGKLSSHNDHFWGALDALTTELPLQNLAKPELARYYRQLFGIEKEDVAPLNRWLFQRVTEKRNFLDIDMADFEKAFRAAIKDADQLQTAGRIFRKMQSSIDRRKVYLDLQEIRSRDIAFLRLFYFLREYGNLNSENRVTARKEMPEKIDMHFAPFVFSLLGFFYGYTFLRTNDEKLINLVTPFDLFVKQLLSVTVKFSLSSPLDYITIESVYKYAFSGKLLTGKPDFIDHLKFKDTMLDFSMFDTEMYKVEQSRFLDEEVYRIDARETKVLSPEELDWIKSLPEKIPLMSFLGLYLFRNGLSLTADNEGNLLKSGKPLQDIIKEDIYFKRESILMAIESNSINLGELRKNAGLSVEHKDF